MDVLNWFIWQCQSHEIAIFHATHGLSWTNLIFFLEKHQTFFPTRKVPWSLHQLKSCWYAVLHSNLVRVAEPPDLDSAWIWFNLYLAHFYTNLGARWKPFWHLHIYNVKHAAGLWSSIEERVMQYYDDRDLELFFSPETTSNFFHYCNVCTESFFTLMTAWLAVSFCL